MTRDKHKIKFALGTAGWLQWKGAYVLVDGQYGSTGKGLASSLMAELFHDRVELVTTNAGPNSGHTSYANGEKIVLKQLPTFSVVCRKLGYIEPRTLVNAGAVIVPDILLREIAEHHMTLVSIHRNAAVVSEEAKKTDELQSLRIGSTGQGTGQAIIDKVARKTNAIAGNCDRLSNFYRRDSARFGATFVEVSQGFSLGINQQFYPYCTSRECTVAQAISDAGLHPNDYRQCMMVVRTYPIRVAGNSGDCYPDQEETSWEELGFEPELTTVTKKTRRVFTWSRIQFMDAVRFNKPDYIFLNFCNYLEKQGKDVKKFVETQVMRSYKEVMGHEPKAVLLGYGPRNEDVRLYE